MPGHAYLVLGAVTTSAGHRLVKMRNPWDSEYYKGNWHDGDSERMTAAMMEELGHSAGNDGIFFVEVSDYINYFSTTFFNKDVSSWHRDHFLKINDDTNNPGTAW